MAQQNDVLAIFEEMDDLPYGPEELALAEEAVRLADLSQDDRLRYDARFRLMSSTFMLGKGERMLAAFAWCRDLADRHPELLSPDEHESLLWHQRWAVTSGAIFPQIPLERVRELQDDFARRMQQMGLGKHNDAFCRLMFEMDRGDTEAVKKHMNVFTRTHRDHLSACRACEEEIRANYEEFLGNDEACVDKLHEIIEKKMTCGHIPERTHAYCLAPLVRLGRWDEAEHHAKVGRKMVINDPDHLGPQSLHLQYLALTNPKKGLEWYARHLESAEQTREVWFKYTYHTASALLFKCLQAQGKPEVRIALPQTVPGWNESGTYSVTEREHYHETQARQLAAQFDKRNGTDYQTRHMEKIWNMQQLARVPVKKPRKKAGVHIDQSASDNG